MTDHGFRLTAYAQSAAPDQADSDPPSRRGRGDVEDVSANRCEDVGPETAILPLLQEHLGLFCQRRTGDGPAVREAEEPSGRVLELSGLDGRGTGNRSTRPSLVLEHSQW